MVSLTTSAPICREDQLSRMLDKPSKQSDNSDRPSKGNKVTKSSGLNEPATVAHQSICYPPLPPTPTALSHPHPHTSI